MRFNQLKSDPNSVVKKRLKKSGTQWIVVSSLFFAGAILFGGTTTVHADTDQTVQSTPTADNQSQITNSNSNTSDDSSTIKDGTDSSSTDTESTNKDINAGTSGTQNNINSTATGSDNEEKDSQEPVNDQNSSNLNDNSSTTADENNDSNAVNASSDNQSVTQKTPENSAPVATSADVSEPNIAQGTFGTSDWYINSDGVLHIGAGQLGDTTDLNDNGSNPVGPWTSYSGQVKSISFDGKVSGSADSKALFSGLSNVTNIDNASDFDTSSITDMSFMLSNLASLQSIDVSNWDTSNVTDMSYLFQGDLALNDLDVSKWNTSSITDMSYLFNQTSSLTSLDVSNWDTSNVTTMQEMFSNDLFSGWGKLNDIEVAKWNTSKVKNMASMFAGQNNITYLGLLNWDVSNVTDMTYMFMNDYNLRSIALGRWNVSNVKRFNGMFLKDSSLGYTDLSNWDTSSANTFASMFSGTTSLGDLDLSNWKTSNVTDMSSMFEDSGSQNIKLSNWNISKVTTMNSMFEGSKVTNLDVSNWDLSNVIDNSLSWAGIIGGLNNMFSGVKNLHTLDLSTWTMSSTNAVAQLMFENSDIQEFILGPNDHFIAPSSSEVALPELPKEGTLTGYWVNVGSGTVENPDASSRLSSDELMNLYSASNGPSDTWVREGAVTDQSVTANVTINSNLGPQIVLNVTGKVGQSITVDVPQIDGYKADKTTVTAVVNSDSTITTDEFVEYVPKKASDDSGSTDSTNTGNQTNDNNNNSNSIDYPSDNSETNDSKIVDQNQTISTYSDKPKVQLYDSNGNTIDGRFIDADTDWQSDQVLMSNNLMYYRVSTDEWVRADDVYVYASDKGTVKAYLDSNKTLFDEHGNVVEPELTAGSDWLFDRYTEINNVKYYRVSTNEFVKDQSVLPYVAVDGVVNADNNVTVYNENGIESGRNLSANTSWKIDKVAVINGIKMYRVSTNEWVKADAVTLSKNL